MYIVKGRNVQQNFVQGVELIRDVGVAAKSRNGGVLVAPTPVMTVTERPSERVILDAVRDANPFFHLFESLWMVAGRNDADWLDRFVGNFSSRFAEEEGRMHGAYGYRWRNHFSHDQLARAIELLNADPLDRRVVIAMWDPSADNSPEMKDLPCNTHMYPRMRMESGRYVLDLTVCCRSNDVVWGCYGANAVHFSFVQEYMAGMLGCDVGVMYQLSNNWHAYYDTLDKVGFPQSADRYSSGEVNHRPIGDKWSEWLTDLSVFFWQPDTEPELYANEWFSTTVSPMYCAHALWKTGHRDLARMDAEKIASPDWRTAVLEWMERRS